MPRLHDIECRESIKARLLSIQPGTRPQWGAMTRDQMLWHLATGLELCLGRVKTAETLPFPVPRTWVRFAVLNLPWPKSAPALNVMKATAQHDFEAERARCLSLLDEFAARPLRAAWPEHPVLGMMSGDQYSRLQAKHFDHHLSQFGV